MARSVRDQSATRAPAPIIIEGMTRRMQPAGATNDNVFAALSDSAEFRIVIFMTLRIPSLFGSIKSARPVFLTVLDLENFNPVFF